MDVGGFVNRFASRFYSHTFHQRKRTVDWGRLCVSRNIGAVCESLEFESNTKISIVPVFHSELFIVFLLVLVVAWKCERCVQTELDEIDFFDITLCPEYRVYLRKKISKLVSQNSTQFYHRIHGLNVTIGIRSPGARNKIEPLTWHGCFVFVSCRHSVG